MPLGRFFRKDKSHSEPSSPTASLSNKEKKSLFGLKAVQAQQNPEPVYDLSGCSAPQLPDDTFTFCKILGKTDLIVKNNCLTSLESGGSLQDLVDLKVLDASYNKIDKLPTNIFVLKNLRVLNLTYNKLKHLPEYFNALLCLEELYLSRNKFSNVPPVICALPRLRVLSLKDNNITHIPKEISNLHHTLSIFELDFEKVKYPSEDVLENGLKGIMKHFCGLNGIDYEGISICVPQDTTDNNSLTVQEMASSPPVDDIMVEYIRKKQQQLRAQISEEERRGALEKQQLENIIQNTFKSREELLHELSCSPFEISDYEEKKQEKILSQMQIEEKFRSEQSEQLNIYLNSSSDKEALLSDITMQEDSLQLELQAIVAAKESERSRLLQDLSKAEHDADSTLNEILNLQQSQKSADFVHLIEEQDVEMQKLLSNLIDISTELRRNDILKAMQNLLLENAATEAQRDKIEEKQKSWVSSLIKEGQLEEAQIESLIDNRTSNQEIFLNNVLQEEEYQAEAFKLLLLKMDLKRNSVIRQISLVEYELSRLSSLELRKKRCGLQYGSTTMLNKRKTLAGLLQSLLRVKNERDDELNDWVSQMSNNRSLDLTTEDFWLLQYQRLMMIKPTGIAEAEETLDPKVHKILSMACALDLMPVFARENITFSSLMNMLEEDFVALNIGSATYHSIQRALHTYLIGSKLGPQEPSAPFDKDTASAPELDEATPDLSNPIASAPPAVQYIETECVVCLNSDCRVLFLPCGHVCVCASCCQPLSSCPLCRSDILSKCLMNRQ